MNLNKSPGLDGISAYYLKLASDINAVPLSILCNLSFSEGVFPNCMKKAKVIPLFKTGSKSELSNYIPISLLSCLSKVVEKLIYSRLITYLNKNSILHHNQNGFRSGLSTSHALLDVVTTTYDNINKMLYTLLSSSSSYLFIYQVTSYHKKKLQLPLGISPKHRNKQFL